MLVPLLALASLCAALSVPSSPPSTALDHDFSYQNRLLLVRHGEKPISGKPGLSKKGRKRAQCFRTVFGRQGKHNIGLIIAQSFEEDGSRARPYETVLPLSKDLGLPIHHSCERDDAECVRKVVKKFSKHSNKDVLLCWKHSELENLVAAFGGDAKRGYPDDRYDILWVMKHQKLVLKESEECPGLDGKKEHDPDLEVYGSPSSSAWIEEEQLAGREEQDVELETEEWRLEGDQIVLD